MKTISNSDDIIDSREVIARLDELQSDRDDLELECDDAEEAFLTIAGVSYDNATQDDIESDDAEAAEGVVLARRAAIAEWDNDNGAELKALRELADEAEGYCPDWKYGAPLIRDSYFKSYAREYAEDTGELDKNLSWPHSCIDWDDAARELQMDYTAVDFDGVTYWVR